MARIPSYLKGLVETRARVAAEVAEYQARADELNGKLAQAKAQLAACDRLIRKYDALLNPDLIPNVRACQGRYGKRGAFKKAMIDYLRSRAPQAISGPELRDALEAQFELEFYNKTIRQEWWRATGLGALTQLRKEGLIERVGALDPHGTPSRWRWKTPNASTLEELAAQARSAGVATSQASDIFTGTAALEDDENLLS